MNPYYDPKWQEFNLRRPATEDLRMNPSTFNPQPNFGGTDGGASGISGNQVAGVIGGAADLFSQSYGMSQQGAGLDPYSPGPYTPGSAYDLGGLYNQMASMKPQGATGAEIGKAAATGAAAGSVASPIGAAVGAVVGTGAALIGGAARKRRQGREKNKQYGMLSQGQESYNTATQTGVGQQNVMEDYYDRLRQYRDNLSMIPKTYQNLYNG